MESARERPPEYVSTNPDELRLPSVPQHEVGSVPQPSDLTLPSFKSVMAGLPERPASALAYDSSNQTHALRADHLAKLQMQNPVYRDNSFASSLRSSTEGAVFSPTETGSVASMNMSVDEPAHRATSVSMDDPDVRLAAEALSGLGNPDFNRTPTASRASHRATPAPLRPENSEEPLLELLVEAHPWVGGTVNGTLSAYNSTKGYTPRLFQYSANLLERNMVNTVSVVGRRTGVESGIRRYLGKRRPSEADRPDVRDDYRRRKAGVNGEDMEIDEADESAVDDAASSVSRRSEYLPAYNKNSKPPSYREEGSPANAERQRLASRPPATRTWSTKLMISTSGLGVALSEASLRSLTYCVGLLTRASEHIEYVMNALKMVLLDYEKAQEERQREQAQRNKEIEAGLIPRHQAAQQDATRALADRIQQLCDDIMGTLKTVVDKVSAYTGGALPENARKLVKDQLLSIPQRWRFASEAVAQQNQQAGPSDAAAAEAGGEDATRRTANRMIVFASEGLMMMSQVNDVVKITLQSAEEWLATLGRRQRPQLEGVQSESEPTAAAPVTPTASAGAEMDVDGTDSEGCTIGRE